MYQKLVKIIVDGNEYSVNVNCSQTTPIVEIIDRATKEVINNMKEANAIFNSTVSVYDLINKNKHSSIETTSKYKEN